VENTGGIHMKKIVGAVMLTCLVAFPIYSQNATKLRVLTAPGMTGTAAKEWDNSLAISGKTPHADLPEVFSD
jgi:hypothetical protein